jgi:hypothetical protein
MKLLLISALLCVLAHGDLAAGQKKPLPAHPAPQVVRTVTRHEVKRLGYGGTLTVIGAPEGSITIEGWSRNEVDISSEIQLRAPTEADLDLLAPLDNFVLDADINHIQLLTTGTHDKAFMRTVSKKFPKTLLDSPWRADYRIRVPFTLDLEVNGGHGPIVIKNVEGNIRASAAQGDVDLTLAGRTLSATVGTGTINLNVPGRSWSGIGGELRVAAGNINVILPREFSGDFDAEVLRSGKIDNSHPGILTDEGGVGPGKFKGRAGSGGAAFKLTVGDGTITFRVRETSE